MRRKAREVIYVQRGDSSAKWLFWGAVLGAGLALMYAPRSGEETRRVVQRRLWKLRAMTEEKLDEFAQQFGGARESLDDLEDEDFEDEELLEPGSPARTRPPAPSAREELERRLAEARARRRSGGDVEEPLA
ncbi:MAG TPA: YtxH domain-containing protein [Gemmatimonadales bacterium]|nr:YtxH domain-containing protein [Gemmatimonadales bacterium]